VRILSTGRTVNIGPQGQRQVTFDCQVQFEQGETLFKNLIHWFKIQNLTILETFTTEELTQHKLNNQDEEISEEFQIAIDATEEVSALAQARRPFDNKNKFVIEVQDGSTQSPTVSLEIKNLDAKDNGLYICAVSNGNNGVVTIEYSLNILQRVDSVTMMGGAGTMNMSEMNNMNQDSLALVYHDNEDGYFMCKSEGGYPAPHLSVFIEDNRISGYGLNNEMTNYTLMGSEGGLQSINPIRWVNSSTFRVRKEMNNQKIRCQAEIRTADMTYENKTTEKILTVYFRPTVRCDESEIKIPLGGANIPVKCKITARPTPEVTWTAKKSNVKVSSNDVTPNNLGLKATTETATGADSMITTLIFDEVRSEHFQQYDVKVENVVGYSMITVTIKDGELKVKESNSASSLSSLILLTAFLAAFQLFFYSS